MNTNDTKTQQDLPGSNAFLTQFYKALLDWLANPHEKYPFRHGVGLCTNLSLYCMMLELDYSHEGQAKRQLESQFEMAGLDIRTPFNNAANPYPEERNKYANTERLDWIKRHANPVL